MQPTPRHLSEIVLPVAAIYSFTFLYYIGELTFPKMFSGSYLDAQLSSPGRLSKNIIETYIKLMQFAGYTLYSKEMWLHQSRRPIKNSATRHSIIIHTKNLGVTK